MKDYQREKLGFAEYEETFIDNLSTVVVPRAYIENNQGFWNSIVFKLFEDYHNSPEEISIRKQTKAVEIFFNSMFEHKPSVEKGEDIINI